VRPVTLGQLLASATPYERWAAPLDRRLVACVVLSGVAIGLVLGALTAGLALLPATLAGPLYALLALDLVAATLFAAVVLRTDRLRHARPLWHRLAFAITIVGALNGLLIALAAAAMLLFTFAAAATSVAQLFGPATLGAHLVPVLLIPLALIAPIALIAATAALARR
jgi:hypothetical protein